MKKCYEGTLIEKDWEKQPLNYSNPYLNSPVAKFFKTQLEWGDEVPADKFQSRTLNRKMKMRDTFLMTNPRYVHEPKSCY